MNDKPRRVRGLFFGGAKTQHDVLPEGFRYIIKKITE